MHYSTLFLVMAPITVVMGGFESNLYRRGYMDALYERDASAVAEPIDGSNVKALTYFQISHSLPNSVFWIAGSSCGACSIYWKLPLHRRRY